MFIAFGGEEAGLLGSKHFVENETIDLKKVKSSEFIQTIHQIRHS